MNEHHPRRLKSRDDNHHEEVILRGQGSQPQSQSGFQRRLAADFTRARSHEIEPAPKEQREPLRAREVEMPNQEMRLSVRQAGEDRSRENARRPRTAHMLHPAVSDHTGEHKAHEHRHVVGEDFAAEEGERLRQCQLRRGDLGARHVPAFGIVQEPNIKRVDMKREECFLDPADHPDKVDIVADFARDFSGAMREERTHKDDGQQDEPSPNEQSLQPFPGFGVQFSSV